MSNMTDVLDLPPLPSYALKALPPLVPPLPDKVLILLLPIAAYWIFSLFFHYLDTHDYFLQYRLHTPVEVLKRNRVLRRDVVRDVLIQQFIQTLMGVLISFTEPDDTYGGEMHDVAVWAQRLRLAQRAIPSILSVAGVNSVLLADRVRSYPQLAGLLSGGRYSTFLQLTRMGLNDRAPMPTFAPWELTLARTLYWLVVPALQFALAVLVVDTWQYFLHRAMHMNQWLYRTFHSRHHRLYVPYAFGALYNHPVEGFLLDTLGALIAYKAAGMSTRQGMWFFTGSTVKTVDDHCGYALPWDPLQHLTSNNAGYHDIHHQSWGIKTNFSQPFFTFWDRWLGTAWTGGDVSARYERSRLAAEQQMSHDELSSQQLLCATGEGPATAADEEPTSGRASPRGARRDVKVQAPAKTRVTSSSQAGSLKSLKDRVSGSLHGRGGTMIGLERSR